MTTIQVFDKPLCCSSGVCGPDVDPVLVTFAADLQWLENQGVKVQRINPAQQPQVFAASELVREQLRMYGSDCLPVIAVNGAVVSRAIFPSREQLASWTGVTTSAASGLPVAGGCCSVPADGKSNSSTPCC